MDLHIGSEIKKVAKIRRVGPVELSQLIPMTRQNVDKIYRKQSIDSELLYLISKALDFNFFELYGNRLQGKTPKMLAARLKKHHIYAMLGQPTVVEDNPEVDYTKLDEIELIERQPDVEGLLTDCEKDRQTLAEKFKIMSENATNQAKYITLLEEKLARLEGKK